jgi:hypothetical protein
MKPVASFFVIAVALADCPAPAMADCQCRANGRSFEQGQVACLKLPAGTQLARCGKELNNSSWTKLQDGCPSAAATFAQEPWRAEIIAALQHAQQHRHEVDAGNP